MNRMKKIFISISLGFLFFFTFKTSFAQAVPSLTLEEKKEEIQKRLEERKELIQERKEQIKLRIEQKKATRQAQLTARNLEKVRSRYEKLSNRFNAAITRLEILIQRIESRVTKLDGIGELDTSNIKEQLAEAKDLLNEAKADLDAADESLEDVLDSNDPKDAFSIIVETIRLVKDKLKEVHNILVHTIGDIRGLREGLGHKTATDSAEVD